MNKLYIGIHASTSGGVFKAPINADKVGAKAFAMFVKNQRRWEAKDYTEEVISKFKENMKKYGYDPKYVMPHGGYLINLGNPDMEKWEKSYNALKDEVKRCSELGLIQLNIHPGSHLGQVSLEEGCDLISKGINRLHKETSGVSIILENTAGKGNTIGGTFKELKMIIDRVEDKDRIGVLLDTCHLFDCGYDLKDDYDGVFKEFSEVIGFEYLRGLHINDSMFGLGSKKDRHESIGNGLLGMEFFKRLMNDERFLNMPLTLETIDESIWDKEIELLYSLNEK